jgi:hypothetical protein
MKVKKLGLGVFSLLSLGFMTGCTSIKADSIVVHNLPNSPNVQKAIENAPGVIKNNDGTLTIPMDYIYEVDCNDQDQIAIGPFELQEKDQPEIEINWDTIKVNHTGLKDYLKDVFLNDDRYDFPLIDKEVLRFCPNGNNVADYIETPSGKLIHFDDEN